MRKQKPIFFLLLLLAGLPVLKAQEAIPTAGGEALGPGGTVSYTMGQPAYTANTGPNGSVAQGVQQSFEITVETGFEQEAGIGLSIGIYPNPATDMLILSIDRADVSGLSFQLSDLNGKLIESQILDENKTTIPTNHLPPAIYFIRVSEGQKILKSFKVVKI